jgi:hypothetical protein
VRFLVLSLLATMIGAGMVAGGVWGVIDDVTDDDGGSSSSQAKLPKTSSPEECAQVAKRDPRFTLPHDLAFGISGKATVKCRGNSVTFTIDLDSDALKPTTFYKVTLQRGRREEEIGTLLSPPSNLEGSPTTVTAGPEVRLRRYDFLTVREDEFFAHGEPTGEPVRAPL